MTPLEQFEKILIRNSEEEGSISEIKARERDFSEEISITDEKTVPEGFIHSKGKKYIKPKSNDQLFEDRVWMFLCNMGADVLNVRRSKIIIDDEKKHTKQIDVIGKFGDIVLVIECKHSSENSHRSLRQAIIEISDYREAVIKLIKRTYGENTKTKFILALDNIDVSTTDIEIANERDIPVWNNFSLKYFEDLVDLLGKEARYQVFSEIFGDDEISNYNPRVPAIKGMVGDTEYYTFMARPADLLKIAYIHHRQLARNHIRTNNENPYQRMVKKSRIEDIREFIASRGYFANNVIVNFSKSPRFEKLATVEGIEYGVLTFPAYFKSAWIIDGQHRLFGYTNTVESKTSLLPVFAFTGLPQERQGKLFIDINQNQKKVDPNLLWDLYSDIYSESSDPQKQLLSTISRIGKYLTSKPNGVLEGHIFVPSINDKSLEANITLYTLSNRLLKGGFFMKGEDPGELYKENWDQTVEFASECIDTFFSVIAEGAKEDWERGEAGLSRSNFGIAVTTIVFQEILRDFNRSADKVIDNKKIYKEKLIKYLSPLTAHISKLTKEEISNYKRGSSESNYTFVATRFCEKINERIPEFKPDLLNDQDVSEMGISDAGANLNQNIDKIERAIREKIHTTLLDAYGPEYWSKNGVIPPSIIESVQSRIYVQLRQYPHLSENDFKSGEQRIKFCDLMHYLDIIISGANWKHFETLFRSKKNTETHLADLSNIRNQLKHNREIDTDSDEIAKMRGIAAVKWFARALDVDLDS